MPRLPVEGGKVQEQERPDTEASQDLARPVLEDPGIEAPRDEVAKVEEGKAEPVGAWTISTRAEPEP